MFLNGISWRLVSESDLQPYLSASWSSTVYLFCRWGFSQFPDLSLGFSDLRDAWMICRQIHQTLVDWLPWNTHRLRSYPHQKPLDPSWCCSGFVSVRMVIVLYTCFYTHLHLVLTSARHVVGSLCSRGEKFSHVVMAHFVGQWELIPTYPTPVVLDF